METVIPKESIKQKQAHECWGVKAELRDDGDLTAGGEECVHLGIGGVGGGRGVHGGVGVLGCALGSTLASSTIAEGSQSPERPPPTPRAGCPSGCPAINTCAKAGDLPSRSTPVSSALPTLAKPAADPRWSFPPISRNRSAP